MSKHTPGPWKASGTEVRFQSGIESITIKLFNTNAMADARLIAAAPELLEACKKLAAIRTLDIDFDQMEAMGPALEAAVNAIIKAEGK